VKALVFQQPFQVSHESVPEPQIQEPTDVIVQVKLSALCGSDLHPYRGLEMGLDSGTVMGHEMVGEVVETGSAVTKFKAGQTVCVPFTTNCGDCDLCQLNLSCRCRAGQLFGWVENSVGLQGTQCELVRVPLADTTLLKLPPDLSAEVGLLLGDNLATGYFAAIQAEVSPGKTCAVVGCGSVGLMAVLAALELGAERVFAIDPLDYRRKRASLFGAVVLSPEDAAEQILEDTSGLGVDSVIEAVGNPSAQRAAFQLARSGGILSTVGVHTSSQFAFTPTELYDGNLTYKVGRCPARSLAEKVIPIARKHQGALRSLFTHRRPLAQGVEAYQMFESHSENCLKILLYGPDQSN
jgi:threonine dehydrogenase-like Zn-dependent dehydrogenase